MFFDRVGRWPDRVALRHVQDGEWATVSWAEYGTAAREVAAGLMALGIAPTDRVGILAGNQPRWHMADVGILTAGGISVPAYPTGVASQVAHVFGHSGCRVCFVGDHDQLAKVLLARASLPDLERIVTFDSPPDGLDAPSSVPVMITISVALVPLRRVRFGLSYGERDTGVAS